MADVSSVVWQGKACVCSFFLTQLYRQWLSLNSRNYMVSRNDHLQEKQAAGISHPGFSFFKFLFFQSLVEKPILPPFFCLLEGLAGKGRKDKGGLVDLLVVVLAQLLLLLSAPAAQRLLEVAVGVLAADHEANLAGWVGGNGCVGVLDGGKDLLARLLQVGNEGEMQPLVLSCEL